ncbi:hypothetical protein HNQ93_000321 [Hymenobacter luteus]|uniref:SPOR domain-containing protein n=2 Tax=Hymenobacter TaxID=89966 RepID=A0A7W9SXH0_9BACT|nr:MULTISPECIES: hypothetical protein [Hymenobacter]MBB4600199.1 hypothetical protein [Hymenobacter latericoloratus]MBB6057491.1 hypothetical protein [Hymenobacter luteus]
MRGFVLLMGVGRLLGPAGAAVAQQPGPPAATPFSRANIIRVQTAAPPDSVLAQLRQHLTARGYTIDSLDAARGLLTTRVVVPATRPAEQLKLRAVRGAFGWKITGLFTLEGPMRGSATAFPAQFLGLENAPAKTAFREVEALARAVPRGTLSYDRAKVSFGPFTKLEEALKAVW